MKKKIIKICCLLLFFVFNINMLSAQEIVGTVTMKETGETLPGVTVQVKGKTVGTITDIDGKFELTVGKDATLIFSSMGFKTIEVAVSGKSTINIAMSETSVGLDEVIVIGYGTSKKSDLTGAIAQVEMKELTKAPVKSFDEALAGRIAGVRVTSSQGQPGARSNIVIRGGNSITQGNSPLIVIDGFPMIGMDLSSIDQGDIKSINVLKDASATAIYGAQGANGVIIVTTNSGTEGKTKIVYDGYYGFQKNIKTIDLLNPYEFVKLQNDINPAFATERYLYNRNLDSYKFEKGYDWQKEVFEVAPIQNHYFNMSGGTKDTKYSFTVSMFDQKGILINSGYKRYNTRLKLNHKVNDRVKVGINFSYSNIQKYGTTPSSGGHTASTYLMYSVWGYRPVTADGFDLLSGGLDPGLDSDNDYKFNPVLSARNELRTNENDNLNLNGFSTIKIIEHLQYKGTLGISRNSRKREYFNNSKTRYGNPSRSEGVNGGAVNYMTTRFMNEHTLTFDKKIKKHKLTAMVGTSYRKKSFEMFGAEANLVPNEDLLIPGLDEGIAKKLIASASEEKTFSLFGRAFYSFKSRYLFTATYRADGSSKFLGDNKWGYFPSASFAWRASEEPFIKKIKQISNLKIRLGWGKTGNDGVNADAAIALYGAKDPYTGLPLIYAFGKSARNFGVYSKQLENKDLKWETTEQSNLGIDIGLFKNKITFTADIYRKNTIDLLLNADLPSSIGYAKAFKNVGQMRNEGIELSLSTINLELDNFRWTSSINISFNKNQVIDLTENQESMQSSVYWDKNYTSQSAYITKIGESVGQMYGYIWEGNYQYKDFDFDKDTKIYTLKSNITTNGNTRNKIQPGDIKYKDLNGDGIVNQYDKTSIGNPLPTHIGGFSNTFEAYGFDLNVFFQWSYGNDILNANRLVLENLTKTNNNQFATVLNRWTPDNQNNEMFKVKGAGPDAYSSRVIEDGSFLRLKTISLGYTVPKNLLTKFSVTNLRVYVTAQNLYTWTNYTGFDPEVSAKSGPLNQGFDFSTYPRARTITFGLKLTL